MAKHVVVSLSGGMDSSTLLLRCLKEYDTVTALSFDYGQKHRVELERAQSLVDYVNLKLLTKNDPPLPEGVTVKRVFGKQPINYRQIVIGEILPSAYFTGKDQLKIAYHLIPILRFVILMTAPVSYPISFLMDKFFHDGDDRSSFNRGELSALVRIQYEERLASHRQNSKSDVKGHSLLDCGIDTLPVFRIPH